MSKFQPLAYYEKPLEAGYKLLPFNFTELAADEYVLTNLVGEHLLLQRKTLNQLVRHQLHSNDPAFNELKSKHFILDKGSNVALDLLALKTRTKYQQLPEFTSLHMFVVTLRCEHSCPYCQVSRQSDDRLTFDMSPETAEKAVEMVFKSPSKTIKIEFQGGEPLLNFERIVQIVSSALIRNETEKRQLQFVIATNLALINEEILQFCKKHEILISTSLDGPADLHNKNRPRPGGNSYELAIKGIAQSREVLGHDNVGALMTTTLASLPRVIEIIDQYRDLEFDGIFLRTLSPYGFAIKTKFFAAYNAEEWLKFYFQGLDYIIEINKRGTHFVEYYATTILTKMLTPFSPGYVDLMNPSGIGIAALIYNYDGDIYASDEARMLAEMGDKKFRLGNVLSDTYKEIMLSDNLLDPLEKSFTASVPMCSDCAFEPFCGAEPVYHHATQGDCVGRKPDSEFCSRNMAIFRFLIKRMKDDPEVKLMFQRWVGR